MSAKKINYTVDDTAPLRFTIGYDSRLGDIDARSFSGILEEWKRLGFEEVCISTNEVSMVFFNNSGGVTINAIVAAALDYPPNREISDAQPFNYNDLIWRGTMTGTVAYTLNNTTVTGTGTNFTTEAQVGMILRNSGSDQIIGTVASIASATSLTLAAPCPIASASGQILENKPIYSQTTYYPSNLIHIQNMSTAAGEHYVKLSPETKRDSVIVRINDMLNYPFRIIGIPLNKFPPNYPSVQTIRDGGSLNYVFGSFVVTPLMPYSEMMK